MRPLPPPQPTRGLHQALSQTASTSMVMNTLSPTITPALSSVSFQLTPKSCRLISAVAIKPARNLGPLSTHFPPSSSHQGVAHCPRYLTASETGLVTPRIVSSPLTTESCPPVSATLIPFEGNLRKVLNVQKVWTAQMSVALRFAPPSACCIN